MKTCFQKIIPIILGIGLLFNVNLLSQNDQFYSGMLFEDEVYNTLPRQAELEGTKALLPPRVDLKPFCPPVRNQGDIFSCVGWAVGYGALTIERSIKYNCTNKKEIADNANSALFIYNQIKDQDDCQKGTRISDAIQFLMENGDCLAKDFDHNVNDCSRVPEPALSDAAKVFSIGDYMTLFGMDEEPMKKVWKVKAALAQRKPVVIGMSVRKNFYQLQRARFWWPQQGNTSPAGGHAMTVIGYDEGQQAFQILNSWGKNWGNNGYIWVKYKYFGQFCKYAFVLHLTQEEGSSFAASFETTEYAIATSPKRRAMNRNVTRPVNNSAPRQRPVNRQPLRELGGAFDFRHFEGFSQWNQEPLFASNPVELYRNYYKLQKKDWQVGQKFQITATTLRKNEYVYVFSIDSNKKATVHWPRQEKLNQKFTGRNESALFTSQGNWVTIPGKYKVLKLEQPGKDRLVVLFSKQKIKDFKKLVQVASEFEGDFMPYLLQVLGNHAIPQADITYDPTKMGFEVSTRSHGYIVPVVLEVESF